jgi:hypothetical protein
MGDNGLIPISDEQAKLGQEALKALQKVGGFLRETFGTVPEDIVGLLGGDWLMVRRAENLARIFERAKERLRERGINNPEPASLSITLPLLITAADESRAELEDIWARLLAAAADPSRTKAFRNAFIGAVKKLDPLDALVMQWMSAHGGGAHEISRNAIAKDLNVSRDEVDVSIANLVKVEFAAEPHRGAATNLTPFGREFLRVVD